MAFDGAAVAALKKELSDALVGSRIAKIIQPEPDELILTFKGVDGPPHLLLSANASLPLLYRTENKKPAPLSAPNFCMLLRKHIGSGKLLSITQPGLERILTFTFEHRNELGDLCEKRLILELMGKHSNLIFCDETDRILDSIKHISAQVSSVREVLPGRDYFIPKTTEKEDPLAADGPYFIEKIVSCPEAVGKAIVQCFTGLSPILANDLCFRAKIDSDCPASAFADSELSRLSAEFLSLMERIKSGEFAPVLYEKSGEPVEFSAVPLSLFPDHTETAYDTMSELLYSYYAAKAAYTRIRHKSADLRHIITTAYERTVKKYDLQAKQLKDTEKREKYRTYGELLTAYAYAVPQGEKSYVATDYHTNEPVTVPLDPTLSANENAQKYFARYQKLKRTFDALTVQLEETKIEKEHLESVLMALDLSTVESDLAPIRRELIEYGYIKKRGNEKKSPEKSKPYHYRTADGFDLYVGKNNYQNDELTFKIANGNDWWFHAKKMPGSHVIVRTGGKELPDHIFEVAAALAAYYSKGRESEKVEIDYLRRKDVKKPNGAVPGYVIYYTNYSMTVAPGIAELMEVTD